MLNIALYEPEIPPNTGNIIRLCANTGAQLHLIHPLGFRLDDKKLKRAGLDHHEWVNLIEHPDLCSLLRVINPARLFACSTKGTVRYTDVVYQTGDTFLYGPESRGLPVSVREALPPEQVIYIPMRAQSRSLNLANACAIITYEALRQLTFSFDEVC